MTIPLIARTTVALGVLLFTFAPASGAGILNSASDFAVLGGSAVTNTGASTVQGDIGAWPTPSITGLGTITLNGVVHNGDATAQLARSEAASAYTNLATHLVTGNLTGQDLGTVGTLLPGVYRFDSSAQLTGTLTLDALNNNNALFIFQIGTTLTTASAAIVNVLNGGANNGIFWLVGSSATLGTSTEFAGNILADQSITLNTSASITCGRALALNGAVTMDGNTVSNNCALSNGGAGRTDYGSNGFAAAGEASGVPEPGTFPLFAFVLFTIMGQRAYNWKRNSRQRVRD